MKNRKSHKTARERRYENDREVILDHFGSMFFFLTFYLILFFDPFLDPGDDAKTSPKHPQNFLEKLHFRPPELFWNMSGTCPKSVSYLTITYVILS